MSAIKAQTATETVLLAVPEFLVPSIRRPSSLNLPLSPSPSFSFSRTLPLPTVSLPFSLPTPARQTITRSTLHATPTPPPRTYGIDCKHKENLFPVSPCFPPLSLCDVTMQHAACKPHFPSFFFFLSCFNHTATLFSPPCPTTTITTTTTDNIARATVLHVPRKGGGGRCLEAMITPLRVLRFREKKQGKRERERGS